MESTTAAPLLVPRMKAFEMIGVRPTKGHELIAAGLLDARKLGTSTVITIESIRAFAASLPPAPSAINAAGRAA